MSLLIHYYCHINQCHWCSVTSANSRLYLQPWAIFSAYEYWQTLCTRSGFVSLYNVLNHQVAGPGPKPHWDLTDPLAGTVPNFRSMSVVAKWPPGTEVGLGAGHIVLDGDPAPPRKWAQQPPPFGACLLRPNSRPSQQLLSSCSVLTWGR